MDIGILDGKFARISERIQEPTRLEIDAEGGLTFPGFIEPHVHLDKCLVRERLLTQGNLTTYDQIRSAMRELKKSFTEDDIKTRMVQAVRMAVLNGALTIRTNVEADPLVEMRAVQGVLAAKIACRDIADLQTVAFPQEGWIASQDGPELGSRPFIFQAMEKGVDIMGGNINRVFWDSLPEQQVDDLFEFAKKKNVDLDIHVDYSNNPVSFALPYVARKTIEYGFQGRVTVAHVVSLAAVPDRIALQTIEMLKEAGITVCVLPIVIRVTRVKELVEAGVNVICGSDNIQDTWSGLGNADPLSMMFLLAHIAEMGSDHQLEKIFQMGTYNAAKALRINHDYGIEEGKNADLIVLEAQSMPEAIRFQARKRTIIKRGRVLLHEGRPTENMSDFA